MPPPIPPRNTHPEGHTHNSLICVCLCLHIAFASDISFSVCFFPFRLVSFWNGFLIKRKELTLGQVPLSLKLWRIVGSHCHDDRCLPLLFLGELRTRLRGSGQHRLDCPVYMAAVVTFRASHQVLSIHDDVRLYTITFHVTDSSLVFGL